MRRIIARPSRSTSLAIQIVGTTARSMSRFMNTLLPRRFEASSSSTPTKRRDAPLCASAAVDVALVSFNRRASLTNLGG